MNKRKIMLLAMSACMIAILAIGGTLAYFTDAEQYTNTMTIGNVQINIEENKKDADGNYKPYEQDFQLYPVANDEVYSNNGNPKFEYYNKVVRTFNTSPSKDPAYIRTIILFEKNDKLDENFVGDGDKDIPGLHFMYVDAPGSGPCIDGKSSRGSKSSLLAETVSINNNEYWVVVFTDAQEQPIPYDDSLHTLNGVWMDKNITQEQLTGWGDKVEILVLSQGIQEEGLTHAEAMAALGEVNEGNLQKWFTGTEAEKADGAVINDWVPTT